MKIGRAYTIPSQVRSTSIWLRRMLTMNYEVKSFTSIYKDFVENITGKLYFQILFLLHTSQRWKNKNQQPFTTLNFANASQNKNFTKSCQDWISLPFQKKYIFCSPKHKISSNYLVSFKRIGPNLSISMEISWKYFAKLNWGDLKTANFFETHCKVSMIDIQAFCMFSEGPWREKIKDEI